jgi:hypothetical protein
MDPKVLKEAESQKANQMTISESTVVEIEKSFYRIQKGSYPSSEMKAGCTSKALWKK